MRILLVEDEISLAEILKDILTKNNYTVDCVYDGENGLDYALTDIFDVILLDIMLPKMDGLEVLKELRESKKSTPIIMLTAKSEIEDKVTGLDYGADDYITKPFSTKELLARIRSATRRKEVYVGNEKTFGDLKIDKDTLKISAKDDEIKVSLKEYQILELLMANPNQIISKEQFAEKIWGYDFEGEYNSVEVYISFVRKKLKSINSNVRIKAVRGAGYSLEENND